MQGRPEDPRVGVRVAHRGEAGLGERVIYNEYVHGHNLPVNQDQLSGARVESLS
ncbi:hypothetical protein Ade02nite_49350 [Paractinoplanes deccanensis]|uniref:Uncharacterized protein n=1 Tax=Paractinoplanes deccanensis TaxID=113561 RepID=A0ABQ3Y8H4_9ACTN|nr:hypothetical protein Ade02nite_49350 [Actinoplanes deccanensis]